MSWDFGEPRNSGRAIVYIEIRESARVSKIISTSFHPVFKMYLKDMRCIKAGEKS